MHAVEVAQVEEATVFTGVSLDEQPVVTGSQVVEVVLIAMSLCLNYLSSIWFRRSDAVFSPASALEALALTIPREIV